MISIDYRHPVHVSDRATGAPTCAVTKARTPYSIPTNALATPLKTQSASADHLQPGILTCATRRSSLPPPETVGRLSGARTVRTAPRGVGYRFVLIPTHTHTQRRRSRRSWSTRRPERLEPQHAGTRVRGRGGPRRGVRSEQQTPIESGSAWASSRPPARNSASTASRACSPRPGTRRGVPAQTSSNGPNSRSCTDSIGGPPHRPEQVLAGRPRRAGPNEPHVPAGVVPAPHHM